MRVDEIKNDAELDEALSRLDEIWSARPGDVEWEERCGLVDRIEEHEDRNIEILPVSPLNAVLFRMEQGGF